MPDGFRPARTQHAGEYAYHVALGRGTGEGEDDALILLYGDSQPHDPDTLDMGTLLTLQLITLERPSLDVSAPCVMLQGYVLLKSVGVLRTRKDVLTAVA